MCCWLFRVLLNKHTIKDNIIGQKRINGLGEERRKISWIFEEFRALKQLMCSNLKILCFTFGVGGNIRYIRVNKMWTGRAEERWHDVTYNIVIFHIHYLCLDVEASDRFWPHVPTFENLYFIYNVKKWIEMEDWHVSVERSLLLHSFFPLCISPREVNFFVFMIFAANSRLVDFWTQRLTIENAPL